VPVAAVSAAIDGREIVRAELAARVAQAGRKADYKPNAAAPTRKRGASRIIGVTTPDITNPFFTDVVSIIQGSLHRAGYAMMLCCSNEDVASQSEQIHLLLDRGVDALIIAPAGR
jgi:LacI family transcriptional regulator